MMPFSLQLSIGCVRYACRPLHARRGVGASPLSDAVGFILSYGVILSFARSAYMLTYDGCSYDMVLV